MRRQSYLKGNNMSLYVYLKKEEFNAPLIEANNTFFESNTIIPDDDFTKEVLKTIDKAERVNDMEFAPRNHKYVGNLSKNCLSTAARTLLNIKQHPDKIFALNSCSGLVTQFFPLINEGGVLWDVKMREVSTRAEEKFHSCDIICQGHHFTNSLDFYNFVLFGGDNDECED